MKMKVFHNVLMGLLVFLSIGIAVFTYYLDRSLTEEILEQNEIIVGHEETISTLEQQLAQTQHDNAELAERLRDKEEEVRDFSDQISRLTGDVDLLRRLEELDEELLKKYSRVYFLNEHYTPASLSLMDQDYVYRENEVEEINSDVEPFLDDLMDDAWDDGVDLRVISAYRSFDKQSSLKSHYTVTYGAGTANQFSADQGYSEHQLGTTVDFTTEELGLNYTSFHTTDGYEWLQENAHEYGFTLSYPEGNDYYIFEPWHWRFVGIELATDLYKDDMHFYDMSQREIDEYLIHLFED